LDLSEIGWQTAVDQPILSALEHSFQGKRAMTMAYYSTIFQEPAADIWEIVRDFNNYPVWVEGSGESLIEDGKSGDAVGAIRRVFYQGRHVRQRLLALSDTERSQTYEFCGPAALPVMGFRATLRISEVVDGNRAFVEWWANFDCRPEQRDELTGILRGWFAKWLESLRVALAGAGRESASSTAWRPSIQGTGPIRRLWP
jgi:Polyketide cyclase / dehydrase and lipid transport